ncbi:MAG: AbrB/MazE/SpoVT family DNA-binding domain-containing protein [Desulfurococcales archaeon]|nr:AbrB/MazE/SpoVT family DNA-binding domain-containing protein [Desulfurococcales archaeon]
MDSRARGLVAVEAMIEARKIQKLGSSSLIVTLPRNWIKRNDVKQGDIVYIIDEGKSVRIIPASSKPTSNSIVMDLSRLKDPRLSAMTVSCIYTLGYDEVELLLSRDLDILTTLSHIRSSASRLLGLDVAGHEGSRVRLRVVIDQTRLDLKTTIKSMANTIALAVEVLERAARNIDPKPKILEDASYIRNEVFKNQHLIIRLMITNGHMISDNGEHAHGLLIGTSLLAIIGEIILDGIYKIVKNNFRVSKETIMYIERLKKLVPIAGFTLSTPSIKRGKEILYNIVKTREEISQRISEEGLGRGDVILLTKIDDSLKTLQIIVYTSFCAATSNLILSK